MRCVSGAWLGVPAALLVLLLTVCGAGGADVAKAGSAALAAAPAQSRTVVAYVAVESPADLDVPLTVKENADVGAAGYPVSAVIPLPRAVSQHRRVGHRRRALAGGGAGTLARWQPAPRPGAFQPTVASGGAIYHFTPAGRPPPMPVTVAETAAAVIVNTGPLRSSSARAPSISWIRSGLTRMGTVRSRASEQSSPPTPRTAASLCHGRARATQYDAARSGVLA